MISNGHLSGIKRAVAYFFFLYTDDFVRDYIQMRERGIRFIRPPKEETYGTVAVFEDLYGNLWDLLQPSNRDRLVEV